jgi:ferredoxin
VGLLLAGTNALAVDLIAAEITGIPHNLLYVEREARRLGLAGTERTTIRTVGLPLPEAILASPFALPHYSDVQFGLPHFLKNFLRRHGTARPEAMHEVCIRCGICVAACPPQAMAITHNRLVINDQRCIRCFCCRELCPHAALTVHEGLLARMIKKFN